MKWTTPDDLRSQLKRLWDQGTLLGELIQPTDLFPKRLYFRSPTATELKDAFPEAKKWIAAISCLPYVRVELKEERHSLLGTNRIPREAWVDSLEDALHLIGRTVEASRFRALLDKTCAEVPAILPWLKHRPLKALELAADWDRILAILTWMRAHPKPRVHIRQMDIPDVHTKFVESCRAVLAELLDLVLPADAVDPAATGAARFAERYGFLTKPVRIRFRVLDRELSPLPGIEAADIMLDVESFSRLFLRAERVFITENEINFLTFPAVPRSIVIFGAGYGWEALGKVQWLKHCKIHYWGDIDTHGYAILNQLRGVLPHTCSILMDEPTLLAHRNLLVKEEHQETGELARLTPDEQAVYEKLRSNAYGQQVRLEQERIGYSVLSGALASLASPQSANASPPFL